MRHHIKPEPETTSCCARLHCGSAPCHYPRPSFHIAVPFDENNLQILNIKWQYRHIRLMIELCGSIWCEEMLLSRSPLRSSDNAAQLLSPTSHSHSGGASQGKFPTDGEILIFRRRRPHSQSLDQSRHCINLSTKRPALDASRMGMDGIQLQSISGICHGKP